MNVGEEKEYWSETFENIDFSKSKLDSKEFEDCSFIGCNFSGAILNRCNFVSCEFLNCNLSVVDVGYSKFSDVVFRDSKTIGIDWTKATWPNLQLGSPIKFFNSVLSDSSFMGLSLQELSVESCVAHNVDFRDGDFSGSKFSATDFSGALFSETNLSSVNFLDATSYDIDIFRNTIKNAKFDRFEALSLLSYLEIELVG